MKTSVTMAQLKPVLDPVVGAIIEHASITEGEESQAFFVRTDVDELVVRVRRSINGYYKDDFAWGMLPASAIPVPEVLHISWMDPHHAVCVSRFIPGVTLQAADSALVAAVMPELTDLWHAFTTVPTSVGYGCFDAMGVAPHTTWRAFLQSGLNDVHDASELEDAMIAEIRRLAEFCPEDHNLVHGDFGSNNVIANPTNQRISAIIDWECAMWGDPLWDIATAFFWRTWLPCMEQAATYWEATLSHLPRYQERIRCYQLKIGLDELRADPDDSGMTAWLQERCQQILSGR